MKTLFVDVETTGLNPVENRIIELAAIFEAGTGGAPDEFHAYCKPPGDPPFNWALIEKITGITWEYLTEHGLPESMVYREFCDFLARRIDKFNAADKAIFAGYNAGFDRGFVSNLFIRNDDQYFTSWFHTGTLDVMSSIYTSLRVSGEPAPQSMKLSAVAKTFGITFQAHSAIEDIRATRQIQEIIETRLTAMELPF